MKILSLMFFALIGFSVQAQDYGIFGGFNSTEFESSRSWDREFGLEVGATAMIPIQDRMSARTGAGIVQKNSSSKIFGTKYELSATYLEVPATFFFSATNTIGFFGGLNLDLKIADDCEVSGGSCGADPDFETIVVNLPIGARFNIQDQHNIEPVIEFGLTDIANDTQIGNSFSLRCIYMFGRQ